MAEISILLKKEIVFAYGECRKNFNDAVRFLVEHYPNVSFTKFKIQRVVNLFFARLYSIWLFTTSVSKVVSSVYSLLTINSMVSNFWCSRTVSKVYSKLIDYYNNFYVDRS
jgi:hypothetical protein